MVAPGLPLGPRDPGTSPGEKGAAASHVPRSGADLPCLWCGGYGDDHDPECLGAPAVRSSATSRAAAREIVDVAGTLRERVYRAILARGPIGFTDDEGEAALRMLHQTYSARRRELFLSGRIRKSGARRWTRSRRFADVYVAVAGEVP